MSKKNQDIPSLGEVVVAYAEPLMAEVECDEDFELAIGLATLLWNMSLAKPGGEAYRKMERDVLEVMLGEGASPAEHADALNRIQMMLERRRTVFAPLEIILSEFHVKDAGNGNVRVEVKGVPASVFDKRPE